MRTKTVTVIENSFFFFSFFFFFFFFWIRTKDFFGLINTCTLLLFSVAKKKKKKNYTCCNFLCVYFISDWWMRRYITLHYLTGSTLPCILHMTQYIPTFGMAPQAFHAYYFCNFKIATWDIVLKIRERPIYKCTKYLSNLKLELWQSDIITLAEKLEFLVYCKRTPPTKVLSS